MTLLITIALGYGITKAGIITAKARVDLTNLVINVILPCSIFSAFQQGLSPEILLQSLVVILTAFGLQFLVFILNKFVYAWIPPERSVVFKYATITNNSSFIGLPIAGGIYGEIGILYGANFLIPMRILMWTSGLSLFTNFETKKRVITLATHPCMIAVILGFAYVFAPFQLPEFLSNAMRFTGDCVRVIPMFIVGSILSGVKVREVLDIHCFYYSALRLIVIPAIMFGVLTLLRLDSVVIGVTVLMAGMPAAVVTAALSEKYGRDAAFASKTIFVSTMLSIVTLPLLAAALTWLLPA